MNQAPKNTGTLGRYARPDEKPISHNGPEHGRQKIEENATRARTVSAVKWVSVFVALSLLIVYWWTDDQMAMTAAVPSLYVCAMFMGGAIGRNTK